MGHARSWSMTEPYMIKVNEATKEEEETTNRWQGPSLPLEAINDGAGAVIRLRTPDLPSFLQR
jgi:hypothetical protein